MQNRFEILYNSLLSNGELHDLVPQMKGEWEKDKTKFIKFQTEMEKMANATNLFSEDDSE